jgi:TRAP-type mannitol/chloroaromatic compound transport system permease small subunit
MKEAGENKGKLLLLLLLLVWLVVDYEIILRWVSSVWKDSGFESQNHIFFLYCSFPMPEQ